MDDFSAVVYFACHMTPTFPVTFFRYAAFATKKYITGIHMVANSYGILVIILAVKSDANSSVPLCIMPAIFNGVEKQIWFMLVFLTFSLIFIVYVAVGMAVRKKERRSRIG